MYVKPPGGKVWHIHDLGEGRSLCGAFSRRAAWLALFISEERTGGLPLCKRCAEVLAKRARRPHAQRRLSTNTSGSPRAGGPRG